MVKINYDDMLNRFHLILERYGQTADGRTDGQTDGRTDGQNIYAISISRVSLLF